MSITIDQINKHFGGFQALKNVSLDIPEGGELAFSAPLAPAKPPYSGLLPDWSLRIPAASCSVVTMSASYTFATETSGLCFSITPCSGT